MPRWRRDGKELYYIAPGGTMMAAHIATQGVIVQPGAPVALFPTRIEGNGTFVTGMASQYDVTADGRFLVSNARGLRRVLHAYLEYHLKSRTLLSLDKDARLSRQVASAARATS